MKQARPYQIEFKNAVNRKLNAGVKHQLGVMATGTGKTFTAVDIIRPFNKRLWITHTEELLDQSGAAMLSEYFPGIDIKGMIEAYGGLTDYMRYVQSNPLFSEMSENEVLKSVSIIKADLFGIGGDIVMASAQTLYRRLDKINPEIFDVVVCDEAHLFGSRTFNQSLQHFDPKLLLGLTATPHRMDGMMMGDIFDEIVFQYNIGDAISDGFLCELDAIQVRTNLNLDSVKTTAGELNQKDLSEQIDTPERNQLLVDSYQKYCDGEQNIVFCVDVEHAQNVAQAFGEAGYRSEYIVGDSSLTTDRRGVINRFKSGETQILTNVMVLTAGFDSPNIGCVTMACPTKSLTKFMQQVGRGTRTLPGVIDGVDTILDRKNAIRASGKPKCTVLDIVDVSSRHKLINAFELDKQKPIEKREFTTDAKKQLLLEAREKARIVAKTVEDKRVSLFEIPTVEFKDAAYMKDPASQKQLDVIAQHGYDIINGSYTKGQCNVIISGLPASDKQIRWLRWKKYDVNSRPGLTYGEFQLCKAEIDAREAALKPKEENDPLPF